MNKNLVEVYVSNPSGDVSLVEIFPTNNTVSISVLGRRFDLTDESAFDLADALIMVASDIRSIKERRQR